MPVALEARLSSDGSECRLVMVDITERKQAVDQLHMSEIRYRRLFEAAHDGVLLIDPASGKIIDANPFMTRLLGYPHEELIGKELFEIGLHKDQAASQAMFHKLKRNREVRYENLPLESQDGRHQQVEVVANLYQEGDGPVIQCNIRDITARKQAEYEIRNLNQQLEIRVRERTIELQETVTVLEGEIRNRRRLEEEILGISEREQCRLGQDLHDGLGQELSGIAMLGDVHARALKAESHPGAQAAIHITDYVRASIASARRLAKGLYPIELDRAGLLLALEDLANQTSHRIGIHCEFKQTGAEPHFEKSAEIHIYRIVQESIANAIKHGLAHHISIESLAGDGDHTFSVTDDGVGFAKSAGTTGMGLHLMNYRSRLIGAEITVDHPPQGGCRITCRLKL